ncbi:MAG: hypothetical protein WBP11_15760 [Dokdonella sp.]
MKSSIWLWVLVPFGVGLLVLLSTQGLLIDRHLGVIGSLLLLVTAWVLLWLGTRGLWDKGQENQQSTISLAEKETWAALFFTAFVGIFLASELNVIAFASSAGELRGLGKVVTMTVIAWIILSAVLRQRSGQRVKSDERDREIQRRADAAGHTAICLLVIIIAVTLGLTPVSRLAWATPLLIANLLILALIVSSLVSLAIAASAYWRDRR